MDEFVDAELDIEDETAHNPEDVIDAMVYEAKVADLLGAVWGREAEVLRYRTGFYEGRVWTLDEIGKSLG